MTKHNIYFLFVPAVIVGAVYLLFSFKPFLVLKAAFFLTEKRAATLNENKNNNNQRENNDSIWMGSSLYFVEVTKFALMKGHEKL